MTNNNFEKRIQEKLNQYQVEPSENLLDNIFEKRAAKSKGALNFSYFKLGVAMLSLVIITVVIVYNRTSSGNEAQLSGNNSVLKHSDDGLADQSGIQTLENDQNSGSMSQKGNDKGTSTDIQKESGADRISKSSKQNSASEQLTKKGRLSGLIAPVALKKNESDIKKRKTENDRRALATTTTSSISGFPFKGGYNDNGSNIEERYFNVDAKDRPLIAAVYNKGNSHLMVYHSVDKDRLDNVNLNYMLLKPMRTIPYSKDKSDQISLIGYKSDNHNNVKSRKPLFIDIMFAPLLSYHNVAGSGADGNYQSMSKSNFNKQYSLRVSRPVSNNINVFAGIGYMNLVTTFRGDYNYSEPSVRVETVTKYINDPILGTVKVVDTVSVNYIKNSTLKCNFKNTYNIVNIPIGLSYNFGTAKFDFGVHGSALLNIYTRANGTNADFVRHQTTAFSSEKKHLGLGAGISFMVAYQLNNKFKILVEPGLQYFRIDGQKTGNSVNEKVLNNGLNIGLRYNLY